MIRSRTRSHVDLRSVVAVIATLLVMSGVAFGAHRLVPPSFGGPTRLQAGGATLVSGLPAIENRETTDPSEARRWSALATLAAAVTFAALLQWCRLDERRRTARRAVAIAHSGRDPPLPVS
jgi:hypothetical protein